MNTRTITFAAVAAACFAGATAYAGTRTAPPSKHVVPPTISDSCVTGDLGVDVLSNYTTKGIVQENQGLIVQPYADLHFRIYKDSGPISSITLDIGTWNSFQSNNRAAGSTTANWYEFDFIAGFTVNIDKFGISPYFKEYASPKDAFRTAYTSGVTLTYDDKDLLGDFALHPYVLVELEMQGTTGNGAGFFANGPHNSRGQYYELGITPAHSWGDLTVSLPIKLGLGSGGFYRNVRGDERTFGFVGIGIDAAYALNFVPKCLGVWTAHAGFTYDRVAGGEHPAYFNPANPNAPLGFDKVDENQFIFGGGLKVAF